MCLAVDVSEQSEHSAEIDKWNHRIRVASLIMKNDMKAAACFLPGAFAWLLFCCFWLRCSIAAILLLFLPSFRAQSMDEVRLKRNICTIKTHIFTSIGNCHAHLVRFLYHSICRLRARVCVHLLAGAWRMHRIAKYTIGLNRLNAADCICHKHTAIQSRTQPKNRNR